MLRKELVRRGGALPLEGCGSTGPLEVCRAAVCSAGDDPWHTHAGEEMGAKWPQHPCLPLGLTKGHFVLAWELVEFQLVGPVFTTQIQRTW